MPRTFLIPGLLILLAVLTVASLVIGPAPIPLPSALKAMFVDLGSASIVVREIRLPRTLLALMIGWIFGLTGAALQGLLRNPLADTAVFGAPQAAALGAVVVLYFGFVGALSWLLPVAAIAGALISIALVVAVAGRNATIVVLVLAGLAIGSLAGAGTSLAISLSPNPFAVTEIVFWLLGSFEDRSMVHVWLAAPFILVAMLLLLASMPGLRALALGDETARSLGIDTNRLRLLIVAGAAIGTGASVAVAGSIGFVGLVAPHMIRPFVGYDPARTMVPSGLAGAALLLAADCAVRLIPSDGGDQDRRADGAPRRAVLPVGDRAAESRIVGGSRVTRLDCRRRDGSARRPRGAARGRPRARAGAVHGGGGSKRCRQDHPAAMPRGTDPAGSRHRHAEWRQSAADDRVVAGEGHRVSGPERHRRVADSGCERGGFGPPSPWREAGCPDPRWTRGGRGQPSRRSGCGGSRAAPLPNCPAAKGPACCSPGRLPRARRCSSSTSRSPPSIRATSWWS